MAGIDDIRRSEILEMVLSAIFDTEEIIDNDRVLFMQSSFTLPKIKSVEVPVLARLINRIIIDESTDSAYGGLFDGGSLAGLTGLSGTPQILTTYLGITAFWNIILNLVAGTITINSAGPYLIHASVSLGGVPGAVYWIDIYHTPISTGVPVLSGARAVLTVDPVGNPETMATFISINCDAGDIIDTRITASQPTAMVHSASFHAHSLSRIQEVNLP